MSDYQFIDKKQALKIYPITKGSLDHHLNKRHLNGLNKAVRKIGKRIYFRKDLLDLWIDSHVEKGGN